LLYYSAYAFPLFLASLKTSPYADATRHSERDLLILSPLPLKKIISLKLTWEEERKEGIYLPFQ